MRNPLEKQTLYNITVVPLALAAAVAIYAFTPAAQLAILIDHPTRLLIALVGLTAVAAAPSSITRAAAYTVATTVTIVSHGPTLYTAIVLPTITILYLVPRPQTYLAALAYTMAAYLAALILQTQ